MYQMKVKGKKQKETINKWYTEQMQRIKRLHALQRTGKTSTLTHHQKPIIYSVDVTAGGFYFPNVKNQVAIQVKLFSVAQK